MKAGWKEAKLEELASFRSGLWTGKKGPFTTAKVLRNTNIRKHGLLSLDDVAEIEVETKQLASRRLQRGDIILERSGGGPKQPVGRAVCFELDEEDYSFSNFTSVIRVQEPAEITYRFLHLVLNWWYETGVTEEIQSNSTGIRNLDFNAYKALKVPLPPLEEQQQIVAILDEAFEGLAHAHAHAEDNLRDARGLLSNVVHSTLSNWQKLGVWRTAAISDLFRTTTGNTPSKSEPRYFGKDIPLVKPPELRNCEIFEADDGLSFAGGEVARLAPVGSILVSCIGNLGKIGLAGRQLAFNQQINVILPDEQIAIPKFMFYQAQSPLFRSQLEARSGGTTVSIVNKSQFNSIEVMIPTLAEQNDLVEKFEEASLQIVSLEHSYIRKLDQIDALRQSLLQKAFAGQLI